MKKEFIPYTEALALKELECLKHLIKFIKDYDISIHFI